MSRTINGRKPFSAQMQVWPSGLAFPMAPAHLSRGEVFRFNLNHVVTPEHPLEMFRTELKEV